MAYSYGISVFLILFCLANSDIARGEGNESTVSGDFPTEHQETNRVNRNFTTPGIHNVDDNNNEARNATQKQKTGCLRNEDSGASSVTSIAWIIGIWIAHLLV